MSGRDVAVRKTQLKRHPFVGREIAIMRATKARDSSASSGHASAISKRKRKPARLLTAA
jgi:hypothetical protein